MLLDRFSLSRKRGPPPSPCGCDSAADAAETIAAMVEGDGCPGHMDRVGALAWTLARLAGQSRQACDEIALAARFHDVGLVGIERRVIAKPRRLDADEVAEIQRHPLIGERMLARIPGMETAAAVARSHHEQWDGSGYPDGLKGEDIPFAARVVAIVDVYEALRGHRAYREPSSHEAATAALLRGDGRIAPERHFDPRLLRVFGDNHAEFDRVWRRFEALERKVDATSPTEPCDPMPA